MNRNHVHHRRVSILVGLALVLSLLLPAAMPAAASGPPSPPPAAGHLQLSRTVVAPTDTISVTGQGFVPGGIVVISANVRIQGAPRGLQTTARANAGGAFTTLFSIPAGTSRGVYAVKAHDARNTSATATLTVRPEAVLQVGKPSAVTVDAGRGFFSIGLGFEPGETVVFTGVFLPYAGKAITVSKSAVADRRGNTSEVFIVTPPQTQQGKFALTAVGLRSNRKATATVTVLRQPAIALHPMTVRAGAGTTITGAGFAPGTTVRLTVTIARVGAATETLSKAVVTNGGGAFSTPFTVPANTQPGTYMMSATDNVGGFHAQHPIVVTVSPVIAVQPTSALPGSSVTVAGAHFNANVQVVVTASFRLVAGGSEPVTRTIQTNGGGAFSVPFPIPTGAAAGPVTVVARGPHAQTSARLTVAQLHAAMSISPNPVTPGQSITVSGSGFSARVAIAITAVVPLFGGGSQTISTTVQTNGQGQYSAHLAIPRNAASGVVVVTAKGPQTQRSVQLRIGQVASRISVSPPSAVPGGSVTINGSGYSPGVRIEISVIVRTYSGASQTLSLTATTNAAGQFSLPLRLPATVAAGTYTISAKSTASGRVRTAQLTVARLAPSIVAVPTTGAPGTPVTINGFGFAPRTTVTLSIHGQQVGTATTNAGGQFSVRVMIPRNLASGRYDIIGKSSSGRSASNPLMVNRVISTHFYFASLYTGRGYHEYLAFLNSTAVQARVQITYQPTVGAPRTKVISVSPHSRFTEDVNADVGFHVSTAAAISADVAIVAERLVFHGVGGSVVPGAISPSRVWYFADGNTSHSYREFIAVQNPNSGPVQVALHILPTHHRPFTVYRTLGPTSRTTFKINSYVRDAVGVTVTSNGPVVANETIHIHHGMDSKNGVTAPHRHWYIAAGPRNQLAHNWIAVVNNSSHWSLVTLHAYGPAGSERGTVRAWLRPFARAGYLMNRVAHQTDVAILVTSSRPSVVEQTTYLGRLHDASTATFGVPVPAKTWQFAVADTGAGQDDHLNLFNPNLAPIGIAVQFMNSSGGVTQRTYVVGPLSHRMVDLGSVVPNAQLGIVAASNQPFVVLNRQTVNNGEGAMTSTGVPS